MPLTTDIYRTGSPNFLSEGHINYYKKCVGRTSYILGLFRVCYILPNRKVFRQLIFHFWQKYSRAGFGPRSAVWRPCYRRDWSEWRWPLSFYGVEKWLLLRIMCGTKRLNPFFRLHEAS